MVRQVMDLAKQERGRVGLAICDVQVMRVMMEVWQSKHGNKERTEMVRQAMGLGAQEKEKVSLANCDVNANDKCNKRKSYGNCWKWQQKRTEMVRQVMDLAKQERGRVGLAICDVQVMRVMMEEWQSKYGNKERTEMVRQVMGLGAQEKGKVVQATCVEMRMYMQCAHCVVTL